MTNNEKIAVLTSDAIRASGDNVTKEILAAVEQAEQAARTLRIEAEKLIEEIQTKTDSFANRITSFVATCHDMTDALSSKRAQVSGVSVAAKTLREVPVLISAQDLAEKTA